jgi:hypothetical protein
MCARSYWAEPACGCMGPACLPWYSDQRCWAVLSCAFAGGFMSGCLTGFIGHRRARAQNASGYASRLLKRADQVRAVCACARLSWQVRVQAAAHPPARCLLVSPLAAVEKRLASDRGAHMALLCVCAQDEPTGDKKDKKGVHTARDAAQVAAMLQRALKVRAMPRDAGCLSSHPAAHPP